jgi:hypothetical protein
VIYIDSDDVLANFNKFVIQQTGSPYQGKETWKVLEGIDNLFSKLEVLPDAYDSVQRILDMQGYSSVEILTALPLITGKLHTAQRDKVEWIHNWIDDVIQVNCVQNWRNKAYFVKNKWYILIDDSIRNIDEWVAAGGVGILHSKWEETNKELKKIGVI